MPLALATALACAAVSDVAEARGGARRAAPPRQMQRAESTPRSSDYLCAAQRARGRLLLALAPARGPVAPRPGRRRGA